MANITLDMNDKQKTLAMIYERTYAKAYVIARQFVKNEEDALDIVQEAYISVFNHMESLKDESKLDKWVNMIVANRCKDWLRKRQVVLFSDIGEDENSDYEDTIENENVEFLPEESVDYAETKRLMSEILAGLPEDQRMCVLMYYYDELSVNEIAEGLGCSTGTVKSRLNYARKKIKDEVEALERKGTKLYGIAPLPFIVWMLRGTEADAASSFNNINIIQNAIHVSKSVKTVGAISKTINISKHLVTQSIKHKVIVGVLMLAVVGGGAYAISQKDEKINTTNEKNENVVENDTDIQGEQLDENIISEEVSEQKDSEKEQTDATTPEMNEETSKGKTSKNETTTTEPTEQPQSENKQEQQNNGTQTSTTVAGLYNDNVLVKDWDTLIKEGTLLVDGSGVLTGGTGTNSPKASLIGKLILDDTVKEIGPGTFYGCDKLTSVILSESVLTIQKGAFYQCTGLTSIYISSSVTKIFSEAFYNCYALKSITVDKNNTVYDSRDNCNAIIRKEDNMLMEGCEKTVIPNTVVSIGYGAFFGRTSLTSITIPESIMEIHPMAFEQCTQLATINYLGSEAQWDNMEKYSQTFSNIEIKFAK